VTSSDQTAELPRVGVVIGDPCGVGPEVLLKSWASGRLQAVCQPVAIGSAAVLQQTAAQLGLPVRVRTVAAPEEVRGGADALDVLDSGALDPALVTPGRDNEACGRASAVWLDEADAFARAGRLQATVMAPISSVAMDMAGVLDRVVQAKPGESYLLLVSGPLRVAHLTDHVLLRDVSALITAELIESAVHTLHEVLRRWGLARPRIAVAGFNPHAKGPEEERMLPGIARAQAAGLDVSGPISPDTVFRHCIEGRYDIVLAMYHDQGHIAIKTAAFAGNVAVVVGPPYPHVTVAHGTAYDIVGRGVADHSMLLNAILTAASLAAGRGFPALDGG